MDFSRFARGTAGTFFNRGIGTGLAAHSVFVASVKARLRARLMIISFTGLLRLCWMVLVELGFLDGGFRSAGPKHFDGIHFRDFPQTKVYDGRML